jgi:hypothetical protein
VAGSCSLRARRALVAGADETGLDDNVVFVPFAVDCDGSETGVLHIHSFSLRGFAAPGSTAPVGVSLTKNA